MQVLEDIFAVFVGVMMVFFFWPWSDKRLDKHDKLIALSAGTLLLITKNYYKLLAAHSCTQPKDQLTFF